MRKVILFELNEVPWRILQYYIDKFPQSKTAQIASVSKKIVTHTSDEGHLHPWVTWPTLHRGVTNTQHKIKDFGESLAEVDKKYPPIWKLLNKAGVKCGVFGSMHSYPLPENYTSYSFYVPDLFAEESTTHPKNIEPFQAFNLAMSRASGRNVNKGVNVKSAFPLLASLPSIGIKPATMMELVGQLVSERVNPVRVTRRRSYQSVLAFDVFMKLLKQSEPQFVTFFSNHAASAMHRYWAATFPQDYQEFGLDKEWVESYKDEIDFTLRAFEKFLTRLIDFIDKHPEYILIVASSMGQAATKAIVLKTELGLKNRDKLMAMLGIDKNYWQQKPAMHPQYNFKLSDKEHAELFRNNLNKLYINQQPVAFREKEDGFFSVDFGHHNLSEEFVEYAGKKISLADAGFENMKVDEEASGTAYHIPEGSMFVYDPKDLSPKTGFEKMETTAIVPEILKNFQVPVPEYMKNATKLFS